MATAVSAETAQTLNDTVKMVKLAGEMNAKVQPQYKKMYDGLKKAIDEGSADEIETYQPQLKKVVEAIDKVQHSVQGALGLIGQLRKDDALMATKFDVVQKLTEQMVKIRKQLTDEAAAARKIDADADKADQAAKKDAQSAEADLDALKDQADEIKKKVDAAKVDMPKYEDAARKAAAKGDKNALTAARLKIIDYQELDLPAKALKMKLERYKKEYPDIDKQMKADLQDALDTVQDAVDTAADAAKLVKELLALKLPEKPEASKPKFQKADVLKACDAMGIDKKEEPKLTKLFNETPRFKWAEALGKLGTTLKLKEHDGKAMLAKLIKLPAFKPQQIDL